MYNIEIERKFLVKNQSFIDRAFEIYMIRQGFLMMGEYRSLRIRADKIIKPNVNIPNKKAGDVTSTLCFKVSTDNMTRSEHEFDVERSEAIRLFELCQGNVIEKTRYWVESPDFHMIDGEKHYLVWEIDIFHGNNEGLVVAEIEIPHKDFQVTMLDWVGKEVTDDKRYLNTYLSKIPFKQWSEDTNGKERQINK